MKLYRTDQLPAVIQGRVCRQSRLASLVGGILLLGMFVGLPAHMLWLVNPSWWIKVPAIIVLALFAKGIFGWCSKSWRAENWRLRIAPDGLWINLRSYLNRSFASAETVLFLPYAEIADVRQHSIRFWEKHGGRNTVWTEKYLEIQLNGLTTENVRAAISEEGRRESEGRHLGGFITSRGRHNHVPVVMPADDQLRVVWQSRQDVVVPSLAKVLSELATDCTVLEPTSETAGEKEHRSGEEVDTLILQRVEAGDKLAAIRLLKNERGYSLTEAKQFVDELMVQL